MNFEWIYRNELKTLFTLYQGCGAGARA